MQTKKKKMKKNKKKIKISNSNQTSFFFEDYLETNRKNKSVEKKQFFKIEFTYYFFCFFH